MRKFFIEDPEPKRIFFDGLFVIYETLFPFMGGFFFAVFENPVWLLFLVSPLFLRLKKVRRYVYDK